MSEKSHPQMKLTIGCISIVIRSTETQDDFASMYEAVSRRYGRLKKEGKSMPDLILIDGGKGQLGMAHKALTDLGIRRQPIISLAKREEEIYVPKKEEPIAIDHSDPVLQFLVEIRDETHRFTNSSHIKRRDKEELKSSLESIKGFGAKKVATLFEAFEGLDEIIAASKDQIISLPNFGEKDFVLLKEYLLKKGNFFSVDL